MPKRDTEFRQMLRAMMDARVVVLSLIDQLRLGSFRERELAEIVRKCAAALVHKQPTIATAIKQGIKTTRHPGRKMKRPHDL